jgi:uncharacterized membrane protein YphA (DoxX/SURF4 family)
MSNLATTKEPLVRQDRFPKPDVVDEATDPAAGGVVASSTTNQLAADEPRNGTVSLRKAVGGTLQPWPIVRMLLAALLVVTGLMKATHSAELLASGGLLGSSTAIALVVGFEWFAATLIAIGPARLAQRFAFVLFSAFAIVASWAWWTDQDCGCFGPQAPEGVPLLIDMAALLLVAWSVRSQRPSATVVRPAFQSLRASLVAGLMLAALGGGFTIWQINHQNTAQAMPSWFGENLIGKEFPLLRDPRFAALVPERGEALIVMLRPDCEHCRELASEWPEISRQLDPSTKVIGISIFPNRWTVMEGRVFVSPTKSLDTFDVHWMGDEPFVASPALFYTENRTVQSTFRDNKLSEIVARTFLKPGD